GPVAPHADGQLKARRRPAARKMIHEDGKSMRVGIEVGGTFTDLVAIEDGRVTVAKVPSTRAPEEGAFNALEAAGLAADGIADFAHGTTVATNAILERKGARVAFVT